MLPNLIQTKNYLVQALCLLVVAFFLSACIATRPAEDVSFRELTPSEAITIADEDTPAQRAIISDRREQLNILALSGGGFDGAYGVGVLNGWTKNGDRPKFDIVTGVSTGALIATLAFLGPQYDSMLRELYITQQSSDFFSNKGIRGVFSDSLFDNTPLKEQLEKVVTEDLVEKIAQEHALGRRLYVGTTNLDANEFVIWDMGLLASGGADGRSDRTQLFQKVLRASAAIPVLFSPVYIKPKRGVQLRQAHVDGAVKSPVLVGDILFRSPARKRNLYVIINGSLALRDAFQPVEPNLQSIAAKSVSGLTRELTQQVIYRSYVRSKNTRTKFHLTAIPDDIPPPQSTLEYDTEYLSKIYKRGLADVQKTGFWWAKPPLLKFSDGRLSRSMADQ